MAVPAGLGQIHQVQGICWGDPGQGEQQSLYFLNGGMQFDMPGPLVFGAGVTLQNSSPLAIDLAHGTFNVPLTGVAGNPTIRISREEKYTSTSNPADNTKNAGISITTVGQSGNTMQACGVAAVAQTNSTISGADACGISGIGWAASGTRVAGNYLEGRRDVNTALNYGCEVRSNNNTATNGTHSASGASDCSGLWISSGGTAHSSEAIGIGGLAASTRWDYGIHFKSGNGCISAAVVDQSTASYSYSDLGSHANAAINIASTSTIGVDLSGGTFSSAPLRLPYSNGLISRNSTNSGDVNMLYLGHTGGVDVVVLPSPMFFQGNIGFYSTNTVAQQNGTGNTHTVAAGSTTNVFTNTTFDGSTGSTAYTVGDIVKALKNYGLLAS